MDLQKNNCNECWVVSTKYNNFWSNVFNKSFKYREPVHDSVTGGGYFIDLKNTGSDDISQYIPECFSYPVQMVY